MANLSLRTVCALALMSGFAGLGSGCSSASDAGQGGVPGETSALHLVIDSGSSGTRFCLFEVARDGAGKCAIGAAEPICAKGSGGLAKLADGVPPAEVPAIVTPRLEEAWRALETKLTEVGKDPALLGRLDGAAALGTGGYRDPATAEPAINPSWDAVWTTIATFLRARGVGHVVAQAIRGEDEGKLAWVGVAETKAPTGDFAIIEIGGATLQLAAGPRGAAYDDITATSIYAGQNAVFGSLQSEAGFAPCYSPADRRQQDAVACEAFLRERLFAGSRLESVAATISPRPLYGLGAPWTGTFEEFPRAAPWTPKTDSDVAGVFRLDDLRALARKVCPSSDEEIAAFAPNSYDAKAATGRACFALSFQVAYLQAVAPVAKDASIAAGGNDQWARGASVTGKYFPDCH